MPYRFGSLRGSSSLPLVSGTRRARFIRFSSPGVYEVRASAAGGAAATARFTLVIMTGNVHSAPSDAADLRGAVGGFVDGARLLGGTEFVQRGTATDAERFGQSLLRRDGDRAASHKLFAVRALVDRAVQDGREETARQWLAAAATLDAAASADLRRFVDVAFHRESSEPRQVTEAGDLKVDDEDALAARLPANGLIELAPNPANTHVRVMVSDAAFAAAEEAEVSVFDALGRVVLTPASVGQAQSALFDVGSLPVGTYTVQYTAVDGRPTTATTRFTVSR